MGSCGMGIGVADWVEPGMVADDGTTPGKGWAGTGVAAVGHIDPEYSGFILMWHLHEQFNTA